jgi:hypothetical protein
MAVVLKDRDYSEVTVEGMKDLARNGLLAVEEVAGTVALEAFLLMFQPSSPRRSVEVDFCSLDAVVVHEWDHKQKDVWVVDDAFRGSVQRDREESAIVRELR